MEIADVRHLVFSSTAAVYGIPTGENRVLTEESATRPINPYGQSKLKAEYLIKNWVRRDLRRGIAFRYFNAAGAMPDFGLGEAHDPETHLIPNILKALLSGSQQEFRLFGDDYPTPDGTCVRDYIHIRDIALGHLAGLDFLLKTCAPFTVCNLGSSVGYSNLEIARACERISGSSLNINVAARRDGDPPILVASNLRAFDLLGWKPQYSELDEIIGSAYRWHQIHG
jgi:UDP-glucose 4-epimerase